MRRKPRYPRPAVALTLRRRPRLRRALALSVGLLSGGSVIATQQAADRARAAWGTTATVLVATGDLAAGTSLDAANTRLVSQPVPLVPDGALHQVPTSARLAAPVFAGEVVREERLAPANLSAVAARLPADTRAMAVSVEVGAAPALAVDDRVDVIVALGATAADGGPPGFVLASEVLVVEVVEGAVTVAVPRDLTTRLAVALGEGAVTLALVGG